MYLYIHRSDSQEKAFALQQGKFNNTCIPPVRSDGSKVVHSLRIHSVTINTKYVIIDSFSMRIKTFHVEIHTVLFFSITTCL